MMENSYNVFFNTKDDVLYHLIKFKTKTQFVHRETKKKIFLRCKLDQLK
jgi:hypothetical protein